MTALVLLSMGIYVNNYYSACIFALPYSSLAYYTLPTMTKTNILLTIGLVTSLLFAASCSSGKSKGVKNGRTYARANLDANSIEELIQQTDLDEGTPAESASTSSGKKVATKIPRVINESVKKWIKYFTVDNPEWYQRALSRSEEFETNMKNILISYDVPEDLFYLALIESAFVQRAHSKAGAKGMWQFMKGTARLYGLQVTKKNDERLNPYRATAAAAAYLRDLYNIYGSWYLAIASYNAGEGRIRNAIIKHRERNFWELAAKNALPDETMNYVPKYIAAAIIAENPKLYGFQYNGPSKDAVMVAEDVSMYRRGAVAVSSRATKTEATAATVALNTTNNAVTTQESTDEAAKMIVYKVAKGDSLSRIAAKNSTTMAQIRSCNSKMKDNNVKIGQKLVINCTAGETTTVAKAEKIQKEEETTDEAVNTVVAKKVAKSKTYKVKYGDTLEGISKRFNVKISEIKDCNPTVRRYEILAGQRLKLNCTPESIAQKERTGGVTHVVRRGESLWSISQKYDVSVVDIMKWNNLKKRSKIFAGRKLKIQGKKKDLDA
ncbi:MAG: LysM peptidoglycan-binding domain-containing protein [bacterium]